MIAFVIRSYIRVRINKKFDVEDFILLFTVVSLCAATGCVFFLLTAQYELVQLALHGFEDELVSKLETRKVSNESVVAAIIWLIVIFSVKMVFLFFFRRLISRLRTLNIWWWFATTLTITAGEVSIVACWSICPGGPFFTAKGALCEQKPENRFHWTSD